MERQQKNKSFIGKIKHTSLDITPLWKSEVDSFQYKFNICTSLSLIRRAIENAPGGGGGGGGGGVLPYNRLLGMCRWMGSHFHDYSDYN